MRLEEIARLVKGKLYGDKDFSVKQVKPIEDAEEDDLCFIFADDIKTRAQAVITRNRHPEKHCIVVDDVREAMYLLLRELSKKKKLRGISSRAVIPRGVLLPKSCLIEPFVVIKKYVNIGSGTYIGAHSFIDEGVVIGENCEIHPHTVVYKNTKIGDFVIINAGTVIGKQGFGFIYQKGYKRIPHIGGTVINDFVEIGSNVTIDCGTIGNTVIGAGTKIDNLVHIGHNVKIGRDCIIMGQTGIAGSSEIGNNVILCGQTGIKEHIRVGDDVIIYAKSGVFKSLPKPGKYSGIPAREHYRVLQAIARLYKKMG